MTGMVVDMTPDLEAMRKAAGAGLFDRHRPRRLAGARGGPAVPRGASRRPGAIVAEAAKRGVALEELPLEAMQAAHPTITKAVYAVLSVEASVASRTSYGGTAPKNVRKAARAWIEAARRRKARQNRDA